MKVLLRQFMGQLHSWSNVGWGIAKALKQMGHEVHLFPTDGIKHIPTSLKENVIGYIELNKPQMVYGRIPDPEYDCQISYTCIKNFAQYLSNGKKNRFGIWAYEWVDKNVLADGFAKNHHYCDKLLAPSNWSKQGFVNSGIPDQKIDVVSHGIDVDQYTGTSVIDLGTKKTFKVLANLAQLHKRKNIPGLLEAWGKAFDKDDDACLIIKAKFKEPEHPFDISLKGCLKAFNDKYPNHAEVIIYQEYLEDISVLYRSVDAVFTASFCEAFYFPGLEAAASGKLNISPRFGGQLDFLDDKNSLLVDGQIARADPTSMYWGSKPATWFVPSVDHMVEKLRYAYRNFDIMNKNIELKRPQLYEKYSWNTITNQLLTLCK